MSILHEAASEVVKSAPPLAVTSAMVMGISLGDWAAIATLGYVLLQTFFLLRRHLIKEPSKSVKPDVK